MARETKVGLLVGLAFIICFAIILANRGRRDQFSTQLPYNLLVNREVASAAKVSAPTPPEIERPQTQSLATTTWQRPAASSVTYRAPARTGDSPATRSSSAQQPPQRDARPAQHVSARPIHGNRLEQLLEQRALAPGDESIPVDPAARVGRASQPRPQAREAADPKPTAALLSARQRPLTLPKVSKDQLARYVAQSGDTLSKIAVQQYGTRSHTVIEAIFQANRATLSSPDDLHVGDELILPPVPGVAAPRPEGPGDSGGKAAPSGAATKPSPADNTGRFRWYQVKEGDRYASIARDELSNERRWREIFELNQDKFPDPHLIRPGVRIKLPLLEVADKTGVRR
jgi:nucleoid-associated protein YgaU